MSGKCNVHLVTYLLLRCPACVLSERARKAEAHAAKIRAAWVSATKNRITDLEVADAQIVRCPRCDTRRFPDTAHQCRRHSQAA